MPSIGTLAGLASAVLAAGCYELGYVLQASEARAAERTARAPLLVRLARRRTWLAGSGLVACGVALQLAALATAPLSVVQPALVLGLGLLLVLAERRLGERTGGLQRLAVAGAGAGVLLVVLGGQSEAHGQGGSRLPLVLLGAVLLGSLAAGRLRRRPGLLVAAAGAGDAAAALSAKLALIELADARVGRALGFGAGAAAAGFAGLAAEMSALQRLAATTVGPLVLVAQGALPVALAPWAVGEQWRSVPAVAAGIALVTAAALVLGRVHSEPLGARAEALEDDLGRGRQPLEGGVASRR